MFSLAEYLDNTRRGRGFLTIEHMARLSDAGNVVFDPASTLISANVVLGDGNVFYPGTIVECDSASTCRIGSSNTFWPNALVIAGSGGSVDIGSGNSFGPGGVQLKANVAGAAIAIGSHTRLLNGPEVVGNSKIGDGCQLIGQITAKSIVLEGGEDYRNSNPSLRGALLKGFGVADGIAVPQGNVISGAGNFALAPVEEQSIYHRQ